MEKSISAIMHSDVPNDVKTVLISNVSNKKYSFAGATISNTGILGVYSVIYNGLQQYTFTIHDNEISMQHNDSKPCDILLQLGIYRSNNDEHRWEQKGLYRIDSMNRVEFFRLVDGVRHFEQVYISDDKIYLNLSDNDSRTDPTGWHSMPVDRTLVKMYYDTGFSGQLLINNYIIRTKRVDIIDVRFHINKHGMIFTHVDGSKYHMQNGTISLVQAPVKAVEVVTEPIAEPIAKPVLNPTSNEPIIMTSEEARAKTLAAFKARFVQRINKPCINGYLEFKRHGYPDYCIDWLRTLTNEPHKYKFDEHPTHYRITW